MTSLSRDTRESPEALVDGFGRRARDLRISITDRCNLRCEYCMPEQGLDWLPRSKVLSFEEIERLATLLVGRFGIDSIRLTGGEPTVRTGLVDLVGRLSRLGVDLSMTTNGLLMTGLAAGLADAGLDRVNISLDTLQPARFRQLTRRDNLSEVIAGIDACVSVGLAPVKLNAVIMRGVNDDEIVDLAEFGRQRGAEMRFIEFMPLDGQRAWGVERVVPQSEIVAVLDKAFGLEPMGRVHDPAERWRYADGGGAVGVIGTVTEPFCSTCDRIRLTAEGRFRTCLFALDETDLRAPMRAGATDDELAELIVHAVGQKWAGHAIGTETFVQPPRSMSQIGG